VLLDLHRLAMRFEEPDVAAFCRRVPFPQMVHWLALNQVDPWTEDRGDIQAAIVAATIANSRPGNRRRHRVADFLPDWRGERRITDPTQMKTLLQTLAEAAR
jgi:hypothetical protein